MLLVARRQETTRIAVEFRTVLVPLTRPCKALAEPCTGGTPVSKPSFGHGLVFRSPPRVPSHAGISWYRACRPAHSLPSRKEPSASRGTVMPRVDAAIAGMLAIIAGAMVARRGAGCWSFSGGQHFSPFRALLPGFLSYWKAAFVHSSRRREEYHDRPRAETRVPCRLACRAGGRPVHGYCTGGRDIGWCRSRPVPGFSPFRACVRKLFTSRGMHHVSCPRRAGSPRNPRTGFLLETESPLQANPPAPGGWWWWYTDACRLFSGSG